MAVTISQQPAEFNLAVGPNIWVLSGISSTANRYALRVWWQQQSTLPAILVATYKQAPNPGGRGIFDVSEILQSYLNIEENKATNRTQQKIKSADPEENACMMYYVEYGEQTGDAEPVWTSTSANKIVLNGYKPFYDLDWPLYGRYIIAMDEFLCEGAGESPYVSYPIYEGQFLTSWPGTRDYTDIAGIINRNISVDEWMTMGYANFHQSSWTANDNFNKSPWAVKIEYFNAAGTVYDTRFYGLWNSTGGTGYGQGQMRFTCTQDAWSGQPYQLIQNIGVGPKNLQAFGLWPTTTPSHYRISLWTKNCNLPTDCADYVDISEALGGLWYIASFTVGEFCSPFEPIQFSFMNEFGVLDYYTFRKRNTYTEQTQRNNWFRDAGSWSSSIFTVKPTERGTKTFNSTVTGSMLVSTDWIDNEEAAWLEKLFTSPFTNAYINGEWLAVNITTNTYEEKTVARNNKMFRYELTFEFSQPQQRQRG